MRHSGSRMGEIRGRERPAAGPWHGLELDELGPDILGRVRQDVAVPLCRVMPTVWQEAGAVAEESDEPERAIPGGVQGTQNAAATRLLEVPGLQYRAVRAGH